MERMMFRARTSWSAIAVAALLTSGCSLQDQKQPPLTGPSDLGLSIRLTATPDQLPRDGSSQAVVTVLARDSQNRPVVGQRLILELGTNSASGAGLSQTEVTTNSQGTATFTVSAPSATSLGNAVIVVATPVGNNYDNALSRTMSIGVNPSNTTAPTAAYTFSPASPDAGQLVTFDASTTTDEGVACSTCTFQWDFGGDGTATGRTATHVFTSAGAYVVTLVATDSVGTSSTPRSQTVTVAAVNIPQSLSISSVPSPPVAQQAATFTAGATAATNHRIVSYQISWGDGNSSTSASPVVQHTYSQSGSYALTLTVRDDLNQTAVRSFTITVSSGLTPSFTYSPNAPTAGQTVTFDASGTTSSVASTITDYAWDFTSDGTYDTNGTSPIASQSFPAGTYRVTLKITDSRGVTATTSQTITVQ